MKCKKHKRFMIHNLIKGNYCPDCEEGKPPVIESEFDEAALNILRKALKHKEK